VSAPHADELLDGYLARLERESRRLPGDVAEELRDNVKAHLQEARAALPAETDADILNILDHIGDPAVLVDEALGTPAEAAQERTPRGTLGMNLEGVLGGAALLTIVIGSIAMPGPVPYVPLILGMLLANVSRLWTRNELVLAFVLPLLTYLVVLLVVLALSGVFPALGGQVVEASHFMLVPTALFLLLRARSRVVTRP
jgi:hypothetical protein